MSGALAELLVDAPHGRNARVAGPEGESWDRAALLALARRTAAALAAGGVQPAEPVHLTVANRPADLGALLGVWLAGAVAVPVHRAAPASASERLRRATGARFAVDAGALAVIGGAPPRARDLLADAALVLFTSGSTGQPKGVVLGHARFAGKLAAAGRRHDRRPDRAGRFPPGGGGRRGRARGRDRRAAARDPLRNGGLPRRSGAHRGRVQRRLPQDRRSRPAASRRPGRPGRADRGDRLAWRQQDRARRDRGPVRGPSGRAGRALDRRAGRAPRPEAARAAGGATRLDLSADALRCWAAARIEPWKLPDGIHLADALPLGPTGKADRAALARRTVKAGAGSG